MARMVTLHDGREVDSSSEEWRHECEARALLTWSLAGRRDFLYGYTDDGGRVHKGVEQHRGIAERQRLERTIIALWVIKQAEHLASLNEHARLERMQRLAQDNRPRMMERIEAKVREVLDRRAGIASNENTTTTERAA